MIEENNYPSKEFTTKQWLLTFVILIIPIVNLVFLLMWAFGKKEDSPRKNYARALLIMVGCMACLGLVLNLTSVIKDKSKTPTITNLKTIDDISSEQLPNILTVKNDIEVLDISMSDTSIKDDKFKFVNVTGRLRNNSTTKTYNNLRVSCKTYDKTGDITDNFAVDVITAIPPKATTKFEGYFVTLKSATTITVDTVYQEISD